MTSSISVLVAEDEPISRVGLLMIMRQIPGIEIVGEAEDGPSAVTKVVDTKPDVTLMDIVMPGFDGIEATRRIKSSHPDRRILMLTSHESNDLIFAALAAGADGYCLKNATPAQLTSAIKSVADGAAWLDPAIARKVLGNIAQPVSAAQSSGRGKNDGKSAAGDGPDKRFRLSPREIEVLKLVVDGLSNLEIAERLIVSQETVKTHVRHIMEKLAVSDRTQAAVKAMRQGLV